MKQGINNFILFSAILLAVFAGVFGYAKPAGAIYQRYGWKSYERGVGALVDSGGLVDPEQGVYCTATLITPQAILTAEHCLDVVIRRRGGLNNNFFVLFFPNGNSVAYRLSAALLVHPPPTVYTSNDHDIAVILLQNPVPSSQATPWPVGTVTPPLSDFMYLIGFGEIMPGVIDGQYTGRAGLLQNIACYGDSGGPVIWNGTIVAVISGGQLSGISLPNDQRCNNNEVTELPIYGQTLQYYDNIRVAMGAYGGPPYCNNYSTPSPNPSVIPETLDTAFALGGTKCSYAIDTAFSRNISCLIHLPLEFSNTEALYPGQHRFLIRAQNAAGSATCDGGSFFINPPPESPQASLNLNNSNVPVNGQVTANASVTSCISPPCAISWTYQTAQAPSETNIFATPSDALNNLATLLSGFLNLFPAWKP